MPAYKFAKLTEAQVVAAEADRQSAYERDEKMRRNSPQGALHNNLSSFRVRKGYKKREMARFMEVTDRCYYDYELGKRPVPSSALIKLAILTGADMNELMLGRPAQNDQQTIERTVRELNAAVEFLGVAYPKMDLATRLKVASFFARHDWQGFKRLTADNLREAVRIVTGYRFHPEELPGPPVAEDFGEEQELFDEAMVAWRTMVRENLGEDAVDHDEIEVDQKGNDVVAADSHSEAG